MKKTVIGICLLCLFLCFQSVFADGTCGTNVKYTIDGNTLNYEKEDPAADAEWSSRCKDAYNNDITAVNFIDPIYVSDARGMFSGFNYVESMDLTNLDVSDVTDMSRMFYNCYFLESLVMSEWDTSNVTDMSEMFYDCYFLESLDVSGWDTSNVTDMSEMFSGCSFLKNLDLSSWNTSSVTDMRYMFSGCKFLESVNAGGWNTSHVTDMESMFSHCSSLKSVNVSGWNTSHVMDMNNMFYDCSSLTSLDVREWDISHVTDMDRLFYGCSSLISLDVSSWDTSHVTDMGEMFHSCSSLKSLKVNKWDTSHVMDMGWMFYNCSSLTSLDLSGWNTSHVTSMDSVFGGCDSLSSLVLGQNTLQTNIFESLPSYNNTWVYKAQDAAASSPLALNTEKKDAALFTAYNFNKMGGKWTTVPKMTSMSIIAPSGDTADGKTLTGYVGNSYQYTIKPTPSNASKEVTWDSWNTSVATITAAGKATCKTAGTARIYAEAKDGSGETASFTISCVVPKMKSMSIITPSGKIANGKTLTGYVGSAYAYTITPKPTAASNAVTWKSAKTSVATITTAGKATCKAAGSAKITATAKDGSGVTASFTLKCAVPKMKSMSIITPSGKVANGKTLTGYVGKSYTYTIKPTPAGASKAVTWKSSKTGVAAITTAGKATCKAAGSAKITATAKDGSGVTASFTLKCVKK